MGYSIEIRNLRKRYGSIQALDGIDLSIPEQAFFGLLGPNGAGKSTLIGILSSFLEADAGDLKLHSGDDTGERSGCRISLVPQSIALYEELSVVRNLMVFGEMMEIPSRQLNDRIQILLEQANLQDRSKDRVKTLSGGMKRRLNIIVALLNQPHILLCDEPTVGVDPQSRNAIFDFLTLKQAEGMTILYSTHYMEEAEKLCSEIAIIDEGKILAHGTLRSLLSKLSYQEQILINRSTEAERFFREPIAHAKTEDNDESILILPDSDFDWGGFFGRVQKSDIPIRDVQLKRPHLEALFLELTGKSLRE